MFFAVTGTIQRNQGLFECFKSRYVIWMGLKIVLRKKRNAKIDNGTQHYQTDNHDNTDTLRKGKKEKVFPHSKQTKKL